MKLVGLHHITMITGDAQENARLRSARPPAQDYDGLQLELVVGSLGNPPLVASHPEIPAELAITGLEGAQAYSRAARV